MDCKCTLTVASDNSSWFAISLFVDPLATRSITLRSRADSFVNIVTPLLNVQFRATGDLNSSSECEEMAVLVCWHEIFFNSAQLPRPRAHDTHQFRWWFDLTHQSCVAVDLVQALTWRV
jgi:hypothetical protein